MQADKKTFKEEFKKRVYHWILRLYTNTRAPLVSKQGAPLLRIIEKDHPCAAPRHPEHSEGSLARALTRDSSASGLRMTRKAIVVFVFVSLLLGMFSFPPKASAGFIIKLPSSLGLTTGLVGHWTFDAPDINWSTGTVVDRSGNGNTGSFAGGLATTTAAVAGKIGQGMRFDGVDDYVDVGNLGLAVNNVGSISAWIKNNKSDCTTPNIAMADDTFARNGLSYINSDCDLRGRDDDYATDTTVDFSNIGLSPYDWHHAVIVAEAGNPPARLYIDGISRATDSTISGMDINNSFVIGGVGGGFSGLIDDVRIYNRALSASEIKRLYNMGGTLKLGKTDTSTLNTGLVGHWTFDAPDINWTTGQVYDKSGNNNTGSFRGGFATTTSPTTGKIGQGLRFDGIGGSVKIGDMADDIPAISISAWVKLRQNTDSYIATKSIVTYSWSFFYNSSLQNWGLAVTNSDSTTGSGNFPMAFDNNWHHVVGVYNGQTIAVYLDGISGGTPGNLSKNILNNSIQVCLGSKGDFSGSCSSNIMNGLLDDVRIYNRALSPAEIKRLYNIGGTLKIGKTPSSASGGSGVTTGLVGHWTFDAPDTNWSTGTVVDRSGNGNTGSFAGGMATTTAAVAGKLGQGMRFDGVDDYVNVANESNFDFERTDPFSISAWINNRATSAFRTIFAKRSNTGTFPGYALEMDGTNKRIRSKISNSSSNEIEVVTPLNSITNDTWQHVVVTYNGSSAASGVSVFINGTSRSLTVSDDTLSSSILHNVAPRIADNIASGGDEFDGIIDDVRIYNRALTPAEIKRFYNMGR